MSYGGVDPQFDFSQTTFPDQGEQGQTLFCGPGSNGFRAGMSPYAAPAQHHHSVTNQQVSAGVQSESIVATQLSIGAFRASDAARKHALYRAVMTLWHDGRAA
ncbi:hypothetical protein DFH09DRAFT_1308991 [Mycena vulgaris]|nr:hypothetical protein DFH09DRAFT_1308991 [Mycena vulgaris]